jgi:hypothetical protein
MYKLIAGQLSQYGDLATGWTTGIQCPLGVMMGFLLIATASKPDLGHTKPPIKWFLTPE